MKRSEVNAAIKWAKELIKNENITLPEFAYWIKEKWIKNADKAGMVKQLMLGWDVTDYGLDTFDKVGGVLFTIRNGDKKDCTVGVPYAEKYILLKKDQALPMHFHYSKTEDIINRAGGILALKLYNSNKDKSIDYESDVIVYMDSIKKIIKAGDIVTVSIGNSITLTPGIYHSFWATKRDLVVGEVSSVNDDNIDNCFNPKMPRFGKIEEDEKAIHPLCNEYENTFKDG